MKYSEFKRKVEEFGLIVKEDEYYVEVESSSYKVLSVSKVRHFEFDNEHACFSGLFMETKTKLFDLACQLAKTPLVERLDDRSYRLLLDAPEASEFALYRTRGHGLGGTSLNVLRSVEDTLLIFTESEIAEMNITGFVKIEVTDGE